MDETQQPAETIVSLVKMNEIQQPVETTVSQAKIEANRRNALKSTGPRTERGKANVRFNALKHGFFAKQVIQSSKLIGEDWKELRDLWRRLIEQYQPIGASEELLVEEIAVGFWRKRRAVRCEMAEIDKARVHQIQLADPAGGYQYMIDVLKTAEEELSGQGQLSDDTRSHLSNWYPTWDLLDGVAYDIVSESGDLNVKRVKEIGEREEVLRKRIREAIVRLEIYVQQKKEEETLKIIDRYSIPEGEALVRILRYQAQNERGLNRAFTQLERLQRQRKGEYVPAPVKVSVEGVQ